MPKLTKSSTKTPKDARRLGSKGHRGPYLVDARLVRILDFERALDGLNDTDQLLLLFKYRDQLPDREIAAITGWSPRALCYKITQARQRLADRLDRLDLL